MSQYRGGKLIFCDKGKTIYDGSKAEHANFAEEDKAQHRTAAEWENALKQAGFSEADSVFAKVGSFNIIISLAVDSQPEADSKSTTVKIIHGTSTEQQNWARELQSFLQASEKDSRILSSTLVPLSEVGSIASDDEALILCLLELDGPVWYDIEESLYAQLQGLFTDCLTRKIIWVNKEGVSAGREKDEVPAYRLIDGLARVVNSEADSGVITTLTLQSDSDATAQHLCFIKTIASLVACDTEGSADTEFYEQGGRLCIPRLVPSEALTRAVARGVAKHQQIDTVWRNTSNAANGVPVRLDLGTPGLLNTLRFVQDTEQETPLGAGDVDIEIRAVGLNYRDILIALGRLQNANMGCECAGIVTRVGADVKGLAVGDRVAALAPSGCYRTYLRVDHRFAAKLPDKMPFTTAAAMLINHLTAWSTLNGIARLEPGETVLIHSAAGGTGQAAVQVARHLGANVIATAGNSDKKALLVEQYGVDPDHIFDSRDPAEFSHGVQRVTSGRGIDAALNALSGEGLKATWNCMGPFGRFLEIGKRDIRSRNGLSMSQFEHNVSFHAFDVGVVCKNKPHVIRPTLEKLFELFEEEILKPAFPMQTFGVSQLEAAFRSMQSGKTMGKIVIEMRPDDAIQAIVQTKPATSLSPDATYVIAGGLGGLGRSMAAWLVKRGAKNLILLSRSGARNQAAKDFVQDLSAQGINVATPLCDISKEADLKAALEECGQIMPRVRGAIQATMVLRDAAFEGMSHDTWQAATAPKVQGSWNMHKLLPDDLDFYIGLSSAAGIAGGRGQANYAAGNTFIDALMRHRVAQGQNGTTLDLGVFFDVGFMTESTDLQARWQGREVAAVTEADLFALLDCFCATVDGKLKHKVPFQAALGISGFVGDKSSECYFRKPMLKSLALEADLENDDGQGTQRIDLKAALGKASSLPEAAGIINEAMLRKLATTLSLSLDELDANTPLHAYGVDSLVAVELRNWFAKEVHADLAIFDILGGATTTTASALAASKTKFKKEEWSA